MAQAERYRPQFPNLKTHNTMTHTIETTNEYHFPVWMAIDNGKILLTCLQEKHVKDFAKDYEFAHGYSIQVLSVDCYL